MVKRILIGITFGVLSLLVIACGGSGTPTATPGQIGSYTKVNNTWSVLFQSSEITNNNYGSTFIPGSKLLAIHFTVRNNSPTAVSLNPGHAFSVTDNNGKSINGFVTGFTNSLINAGAIQRGTLVFPIDKNNTQSYTILFTDGNTAVSWQTKA